MGNCCKCEVKVVSEYSTAISKIQIYSFELNEKMKNGYELKEYDKFEFYRMYDELMLMSDKMTRKGYDVTERTYLTMMAISSMFGDRLPIKRTKIGRERDM
jgi:hypothetical protein